MEKISKHSRTVGIVGLVLFVIGIVGWQGVVHSAPDALELTESAVGPPPSACSPSSRHGVRLPMSPAR